MTDIERIEAVAASIGGTLNAKVIAGGDVININLNDPAAVEVFFEHFRHMLGDQAARSYPVGEDRVFALSAGDTTLVISESFATALPKQSEGMDRYLFLLFKRWREQAQRYVPVAGRAIIQPRYNTIERTEQGTEEREHYDDVREATARHSAMALIGVPGSGKSTALQLLTRDAVEKLAGDEAGAKIPLWAPLNKCHLMAETPQQFVERMWHDECVPGDPAEMLRDGKVVLLLDGLNEMPRHRNPTYRDWAHMWGRACQAWERAGNHIVVTCRTLDYSEPLKLQEIRLESFDPERIHKFLRLYLDDETRADALFQELLDAPSQYNLLGLFGVPYYLAMLVEVVREGGDIPRTRAELFTQVVRSAMKREISIEQSNSRFTEALLNARRRECLQKSLFWPQQPYYLADHPDEGKGGFIEALALLASYMQTEAPVKGDEWRIENDLAKRVLSTAIPNASDQENALYAGADIGVLTRPDSQTMQRIWSFRHHQLREYFAARDMVRRLRLGELDTPASLWAMRWRKPNRLSRIRARFTGHVDFVEPLDPSTLGRGGSYPITPDDPTGWEETTVLAAGLLAHETDTAAAFVRAILLHNPVLAARCLLELTPRPNRYEWPPFAPELEALADETREILLARMSDPVADRRARLGAGFALGDLGDPRFPVHYTEDGVAFIAPHWCEIPGGTFTMGSADDDKDSYGDERPAHPQTVAAFRMAAYPVTVAEYACFVAAEGYEDERWWETEDAKAWLKGEALEGQGQSNVAYFRGARGLADTPEEARSLVNELLDKGYDEETVETIERIWAMGDEEFEALCASFLEDDAENPEPETHPSYWDDADYNNPSQPVVGVSWYAARAYCAWLEHCLGHEVRLPVEPEWERAARGPRGWKYPWGDKFDMDKANTVEGRIRRPSPVGAFPAGVSPWGLYDMAGNVYDWTLSLWGEDYEKPTTGAYPYNSDDGREDINAPVTASRVVRGGSFANYGRSARAAFRRSADPDDDDIIGGLRVSAPIFSFLNHSDT